MYILAWLFSLIGGLLLVLFALGSFFEKTVHYDSLGMAIMSLAIFYAIMYGIEEIVKAIKESKK